MKKKPKKTRPKFIQTPEVTHEERVNYLVDRGIIRGAQATTSRERRKK